MKKLALRLLIFAVLIGLATQSAKWLFAYQVMEKVREFHRDTGSISYAYLDARLDGSLIYSDVSYTSFVLKRSATAERLLFQFDGLSGLLDAVVGSSDQLYANLQAVKVEGGLIENNGRAISDWFSTELHPLISNVFQVYGACAQYQPTSNKSLAQMGVQETRFDGRIGLGSAQRGEPSSGTQLSLNLHALGALRLEGDFSLLELSKLESLLALPVSSLSFSYIDQGFFRRLSNFCEPLINSDRSAFSSDAAQSWAQSLSDSGIRFNQFGQDVYAEFLRLGGKIEFSVERDQPIPLKQWFVYDQNMSEYWSMSGQLNGGDLSALEWFFDSSVFDPKPVDSKPKLAAPPVRNYPNTILVSPDPEVPEPGLDDWLGQVVKVEMVDGKIHQGPILRVDEFTIEIDLPVQGGKVSFSIDRAEIQSASLVATP